ncbi:myosin heavy chain kinase B-like [Rhopilema esculentum]|uniref:myosin heavy chain kinase B-like n=1 Tax=Rhopilema esculentum TaxID=499914 RepID=UPI0031D7695E
MAAKGILNRLEKKIEEKELFGSIFSYDEIYFSMMEDVPVTVEPFLAGTFVKYVNNNGEPIAANIVNKDIHQKAEAVCHFSLADSEGKLLLLDLQGVRYKLCDPEIATSSLADSINDAEKLFCAGNLQDHAFKNFSLHHVCNLYCKLLNLDQLSSSVIS